MAEKYYSFSPYTYCLNNPIRFIDPNGMETYTYTGSETQEMYKKQKQQGQKMLLTARAIYEVATHIVESQDLAVNEHSGFSTDAEMKSEMVKTVRENINVSVEFEETPKLEEGQSAAEKPKGTKIKIKSVTVSPAFDNEKNGGNAGDIVTTVVKNAASNGYKIYKGVKPFSKFVTGPASFVMKTLEAGAGSDGNSIRKADKQIASQKAKQGLYDYFLQK